MVRSSGPRTASTMQNSEAPRAAVSSGGGEHLVGVEEGGGLDRGVEAGGLGAEVAVLGAAAGLGRQDALDLDLGTAPGQADLVGQGGQRRDPPSGSAARPASSSPVSRRRSSRRARLGRGDARPGPPPSTGDLGRRAAGRRGRPQGDGGTDGGGSGSPGTALR